MNRGQFAGYAPVDAGGARGCAVVPAAAWLEKTLLEHGTLRNWADHTGTLTLSGGRTQVRVVPAPVAGPDGRDRWACRRYVRGGLAAKFLSDRYLRLGSYRPLAEILHSQRARALGVRTPAIVAAAVYTQGAFYRADLVTELVPEVRSLADALFVGPAVSVRAEVLAAAGRLVRSLEDAGVLHADLNAGNILVSVDVQTDPAWVVDLDRCRVLPNGGEAARGTMRGRLERSLTKLGERHRSPLTAPEWATLRAGYELVA